MTTLDTTFAIGEKVKVKTYKDKPDYWVSPMKKYMGTTVTIRDIQFRNARNESGKKTRIVTIKLKEDQSEVPNGWDWSPFNFENI
jgi:hypothetical protein